MHTSTTHLDQASPPVALGSFGGQAAPLEQRLARITRLARRLFDVPIAFVSLVDAQRVWLRACQGMEDRDIAPERSFCAHAIASDDMLVVRDALRDSRFAGGALVAEPPRARFYAGQPFKADDGRRVGTLCIMDSRPRDPAALDLAALRDLAAWAEDELRLAAIDAQERARAAALERAERFRVLIEEMPVITYIAALDDQSSTIYTSPQIERLLGFSQAQWMADNQLWFKQIHPEDRARVWAELCQARATGRLVPCEYRMLTRDGLVKWFRDVAAFALDERGQPYLLQGMMFDITEHKLAEAALQVSEDRYRNLVECAQDIIFTLAPDGHITSLNSSFEIAMGWPPSQWLGQRFEPLVHEEDLPSARTMIQRALAGERPEAFELRVRTVAGAYRHGEFTVTAQVQNGAVVGVLGIGRDIAERRLSEEALRVSEARNRALVDALPDLMFRLSRDGVYLDYKADRMSDLLLPPEQFLGRTIYDVLPPDLARQFHDNLLRALETGALQVLEYHLNLSGVPRDFEARMVVYGEHEVVAIVRDITERKQIDRMKNDFISTVSHELRTPLTSIIGSLALMAGGASGQLPERARTMVDIAYNNSERLLRLINDILDIEKIEAGQMVFHFQAIELAALLEHVVEANRAYARQYGVAIDLVDEAGETRINTDVDRLIQALTNLLSNAVKFSPPDGSVTIAASQRSGVVRIAITDRGPGIPESFRERLFQKFAQADSSDTRRRGGTGLGLSITKAIVEKLGGAIGYETWAGHGTTFYIDLSEHYDDQILASAHHDDRRRA